MTEKHQELFPFDKFEPIKGYPELRWAGKRPFTGTSYYPAQLKESYGSPSESGWMNRLYWGDNLQVMSHLLKEFRGEVDLIYIDPPFDSKADYKKTISLRGKKAESDTSSFEEKQYGDIWTNDEYLQFMYERLVLCRELLSDTGSIYLHCDWHRSHYLRMIMDEVFGYGNFASEIVWKKLSSAKAQSQYYANSKDTILFYGKSPRIKFEGQYIQSDKDISTYSQIEENTGRRYGSFDFTQSGQGEPKFFGEKLLEPPAGKHWIWSQDKITEGMNNGRIIFTKNGTPRVKRYLDEKKGNYVSDLWNDVCWDDNEVAPMSANSSERVNINYPTQKPEALLERIIKASSNPGDLVFDCFMGSGTTQAVAMKLGRRFLGADINMGAIQTTTKRLINCAKELNGTLPLRKNISPSLANMEREGEMSPTATEGVSEAFTGFEVYNVNDYDFFRNELEAKRLIIEALGMQAMPENSLWDAELDGRMVAILGINRIATASEFERIVANIDIKSWSKLQQENLNKPVEKVTFVCMGHDPNLKAMFENRMSELGFKVDLEIVDILRDKKDLRFKRDADAAISVRDGKLYIAAIYPMNLLQKLSLDNEDVEDWKELVDSVLIDWHYDGVTFSPETTDVPDAKSMVMGSYAMPKDASRIHIKITDLISESWEGTFDSKGGKI